MRRSNLLDIPDIRIFEKRVDKRNNETDDIDKVPRKRGRKKVGRALQME